LIPFRILTISINDLSASVFFFFFVRMEFSFRFRFDQIFRRIRMETIWTWLSFVVILYFFDVSSSVIGVGNAPHPLAKIFFWTKLIGFGQIWLDFGQNQNLASQKVFNLLRLWTYTDKIFKYPTLQYTQVFNVTYWQKLRKTFYVQTLATLKIATTAETFTKKHNKE